MKKKKETRLYVMRFNLEKFLSLMLMVTLIMVVPLGVAGLIYLMGYEGSTGIAAPLEVKESLAMNLFVGFFTVFGISSLFGLIFHFEEDDPERRWANTRVYVKREDTQEEYHVQ